MTKTLPPPLVPAHVDLTGFDWFPLKFKRLKESDWWVSATDFARSRNVDLWCASYEEVPAASLPDTDAKLAQLAGFGRDVNAFLEKKAEIMAPWTLCSDGRWYHPTLAEVALEAWQRKRDAELAREADAARKRRARHERKGASAGHPGDVRRTSGGAALDTAHASGGASAPAPPDRVKGDIYNPPTPLGGGARTSDGRGEEADGRLWRQVWDMLPEASRASSSPDKFEAAWRERIAEGDAGLDLVQAARGANEFWRKPENAKRIPAAHRWLSTGRYKAHMPKPKPPPWPGPAHIRQAVVEALGAEGEAFAQLHLDQCCGFRHLPTPAVICSTGYVHDKLTSRVGSVFRRFGVEILRKEQAA